MTTLNHFKYFALVDSGSFGAPPKLFIAIGVIMFLIAFLGCCGACMENHAMIMAVCSLVKQVGNKYVAHDDDDNRVCFSIPFSLGWC